METQTSLVFPPFRLEVRSEQLWQEDVCIPLRPKTFALLRYLVEHAGQVVTKDELLDAIWAGTVVTDSVLKGGMRELRLALGDDVQQPRYIATVHRRGYRFVGQLRSFSRQETTPAETAPLQRVAEDKTLTRKLAAILSADVQGYSRLVGWDEGGTVRTLTTCRTVMTELIAQHHGRVVDASGGNLLAEFASAVDALQSAVAIQRTLGAKNAALLPEQQMASRIGLNVGDVIVEGMRLYGDGVNVAARLEEVAEPGGVCISGTVYDQIKTKVALDYESLGEQQVKNIAEPVRVYRVRWEAEGEAAPSRAISIPQGPPMLQPQARLVSPLRCPFPEKPVPMVGREEELKQLAGHWEQALHGARQLVFVMGEPGIGKTTLVETFLRRLEGQVLWLGRGQCIEQYGAGEAYMPILEALGRLCREPGGEQFITLLHRYAPTWLVQMPALLSASDFETLQRKVQGGTRERMLREMGEAVDALTAEQPLVLWLEDLHWSDPSTLELLGLLARRREAARLLVIGTYRPVDVIVREHPLGMLKQELQLHEQCTELQMRLLTEEAVEEYLMARFEADTGKWRAAPLQQLVQVIHQRTEGNALFMVDLVDHLVRQGLVVKIEGHWQVQGNVAALAEGIPANLRQLLERQIAQLRKEEQRVLEVASVAGAAFTVAAVSTQNAEAIEEVCEALAWQGRFLHEEGVDEWPDGTVSGRYRFRHGLYHRVLYERVAEARRVRLHRQIAARLEAAYGARVGELAAELAMHFERGRDYEPAVKYLWQAAKNAGRRNAPHEVVELVRQGLKLLTTLPNTQQHVRQELDMQMALGRALMATRGEAALEAAQAYTRARELCLQVGATLPLFLALSGLGAFHLLRAELSTAHALGEQLLSLAQQQGDPTLLAGAHLSLGLPLFWQGELSQARAHLEQGSLLYAVPKQDPVGFRAKQDRCVLFSYYAVTLWQLGYPDQALTQCKQALELANELADPILQAAVFDFAAWLHQLRQEWRAVQEQTEAAMAVSTELRLPYWLAVGTILCSWAHVVQVDAEEGLTHMQQGLLAYQRLGAQLVRPYWLALLAEANGKTGKTEEGLVMIANALAAAESTGEHWYEAELYRLKGELMLQQEPQKNNRQQATGKRNRCASSDLSWPKRSQRLFPHRH